jgi:hypothetical protein
MRAKADLGEKKSQARRQLRDFDIANCVIKADRTHNEGK